MGMVTVTVMGYEKNQAQASRVVAQPGGAVTQARPWPALRRDKKREDGLGAAIEWECQ